MGFVTGASLEAIVKREREVETERVWLVHVMRENKIVGGQLE